MASLAICGIDEDVIHTELIDIHPVRVEHIVNPPDPIEFENDRVPPGPPQDTNGTAKDSPESVDSHVSNGDSTGDDNDAVANEEVPTGPSSGIPWDELANCESGYGDGPTWDINTGNGFYGGLQFEKRSWDWAGGQQYAEYPHHATREQQIAVAERLLEMHPAGIGAWPSCADKLGLR